MTTNSAAMQGRIIDATLPPMSALDLLGWKLNGLRNRLDDFFWERRLGITTTGRVDIHQPDSHFYGTFAYWSIFRILDRLDWRCDDVFVDIGCGKGRVVCCAAMRPIRKAVGVDLEASLCEQARLNASAMRHRNASIEIIHAPAQEVNYTECTKILLFNPFGATTLRQVIASIRRALVANPRQLDLIYVNPVHDDVIAETRGFERLERWHWRPWSRLKHDVSFWRYSLQV